MDYISAEEFLKQPNEVQKVFLDWWQQNILPHDLYKTRGTRSDVICLKNDIEYINAVKDLIKDAIPLFTEGQLRRFIEDKGYKYIGINNFLECEGDQWNIKIFKTLMQFGPDIELYRGTPLECYWTAALLIATEEI